MDQRKFYNPSLMSQDEIYNLLDSIEVDNLDTDDEDNFSDDSTKDPNYDKISHNSNIAAILDSDEDKVIEFRPSMNESTIENEVEPGTSQAKKQRLEEVMSPNKFLGSSSEIDPKSGTFKNILWRRANLQLHKKQIEFKGNEQLPERFYELKTPFDCFKYFVDDDFFHQIANETNLYARQINISTKFITSAKEIQKYVGILFYMSIYRYPNTREYWAENSFEPIREAMTRSRFEEIRRFLHFNDNNKVLPKDDPQFDPLFKVRLLIDHFNRCFQSVPMCQRICVDEQMCSTKMVSHLRQYMPAKPHKWGMKLFVLCDSYGYSYGFELYSGARDNVTPNGAPNLGAAANVVSRLSQIIPNHQNHILYFDNFYTTLPLMVYLYSRGIYSLGTLRANRIVNCKLPTEKEAAKERRGYSPEYVGSCYGVELSTTLWKDNKCVRLASTYVGILPFKDVEHSTPKKALRYDRVQKKRIEVECPTIIHEYNKHMGGVDLMDGLLGRYHIRMKTVKWTSRFFYHVLDLAMINAYLLYKRINRHLNVCNADLPQFRKEVAAMLCKTQIEEPKKRSVGRPRSASMDPDLCSKRKGKRTYLPVADVRFDGFGHFPVWLDRSGKRQCKLPGCKSETQCTCSKCKVNLCCTAAKNCFATFHKN